ncbi:MAG TPA: GTPase domain-containing protein [Polyangiaceae bacterium]|nr:GTPase domain-containing protein [Polyangiaceae bacterium]
MPVVNALARELVFKVVYYGPGLGGKTTSLQHIHATTRPENRGKMVSLATPVDRTLYFDFLPIRVPSARDMTVRLQLFTVPGQVYYNATRKLVLTGADGVVFVVDSQRARADANIESLRNLEENLLEHGRGLDELPHVFSYNKRDLPGLVPIDDMERLLNPHGAPSFATVATTGEGVYETLEAITRAVLEDFEHRMPEHRGLVPSPLMLPEGGLAEALRLATPNEPQPRPVEPKARLVIAESPKELDLSLPPPESTDIGERAARALTETGMGLRDESQEHQEHRASPPAVARARRPSLEERVKELVPELLPDVGSELLGDEVASPVDAMSRVVARLSSGLTKPPSDQRGASLAQLSERQANGTLDTAAVDVGAPRTPTLDPRLLEATQTSVAARARREGFSLASLWHGSERQTAARIEEAIALGEYRDAVLLTDVAVQRSLDELSEAIGSSSSDRTTVTLLLGLSAASILEFRLVCERSRPTSGEPTENEAKVCLLFATMTNLSVSKALGRAG